MLKISPSDGAYNGDLRSRCSVDARRYLLRPASVSLTALEPKLLPGGQHKSIFEVAIRAIGIFK